MAAVSTPSDAETADVPADAPSRMRPAEPRKKFPPLLVMPPTDMSPEVCVR